MENGYLELGDVGGCGLGRTTASVLSHINFLEDPHYVSVVLKAIYAINIIIRPF